MRPLDPRLVREAKATIWYLATVVVLAFLSTLSTIGVAYGLASFIVEIFTNQKSLEQGSHFLAIAAVAAIGRAGAQYLQEYFGFQASFRVKQTLRSKALTAIERDGDKLVAQYGTGTLSLLLGPALDSLDIYFAKYLPQLVFTALVTPFFVVLVWWIDFTSAVALVFTLPLIPLFLILIGLATREVQQKQLSALARLNNHFYEILRGIQTLKIFGRTKLQEKVLADVAGDYRNRTMRVLRLSFLSGFALELAASLSVALIAVTIGLRLVSGELDLLTGLFVLLIAPEAYLPLRNVGAQFHAAAEGVEVSSKVLDLIERPVEQRVVEPLSYQGIVALTGPSGSGKTTRLKSMRSESASWLPQQSSLLSGTIRENIAGFEKVDEAALTKAVELAALDDVPLGLRVGAEGGLSGGQIQRVSLARTFYHHLIRKTNFLLLDEPTSQQDESRQSLIASALLEMASSGTTVILATHQQPLLAIANQEVTIG